MAPKVQPLIKSPKSPQQQQQQQQFQWNQCSACGYIILKSNNDEHECFKLNNSHSYIFKNELLNVQQIIEHPKGRQFTHKHTHVINSLSLLTLRY